MPETFSQMEAAMSYYGKLPIVLLSEIASAKEDTYRCRIATYLLGRGREKVTVEEIARDCFVSKSAVSRFCREIGLEDFDELKEIVMDTDRPFGFLGNDLEPSSRASVVVQKAADAMQQVAETLDYVALHKLVSEMQKAKRIACFGLLKAETAAINLQCDLTMLGFTVLTKVSYKDQMDFLSQSEADDLILIFSYQGIFFEYDLPAEMKNGKGRIWIITGNPSAKEQLNHRSMIHDVLSFDSALDFLSHPYQLLAVSGIIAQETAAVQNNRS